MDFVIAHVPDGVPFEIYIDEIGEDNRVTEDFDALQQDAVFHVVESAGGGLGGIMKVLDPLGVINRINKIIFPSAKSPSPRLGNNQVESPNNSLTDRSNKPRPYERSYDICGTVQTIPNDLMTTYKVFNAAGNVIEYAYYDAGRGPLQINAADITDGDTRVQEITGTSVAVYAPYTSPNNTATPQLLVGDQINQGLYVTFTSNEIDGIVLKAQNGIRVNPSEVGEVSLSGTTGILRDITGDSEFDELVSVGDTVVFTLILIQNLANLSGTYTVTYVDTYEIRVALSGAALVEWQKLPAGFSRITQGNASWVGPQDTYAKSLTDWVSINRAPVERVVVNVAAGNGMYKDNGETKFRTAVTVEMQYQALTAAGTPTGPVYTQQGVISGRSSDYTGVTVYGNLPTPSPVRVRMRRVTDLDLGWPGTVVDEVTYINLYGQSIDHTPHYGNRTTVHSARKQTPRATELKQPQLRMVATELVYKYLGNGVFDTVLTPNTKAVQSLIRLMRDPVVGGLNLSVASMDNLLAVQTEIETYFGSALAGQFCYTFDDYRTTAQDIITTIAEAIFCTSYRKGKDIVLDFERPRPGPEMVFTHRSKTPGGEKWTRRFNDRDAYDSVKYTFIDPDTNIRETITIPPAGGVKTDTYDSKGVRNYAQAFWHAYRRYQKNTLSRVSVEFTATEEGIFAVPGRPISVVKGARVAPYDGYVVAVNGMELTLSQPVEFTEGDDHSVILKKRDGSVQSIAVSPGSSDRKVIMQSAPQESIYTGNSALKTEFSFGNEERHNAQMMIVSTVDPGSDRTAKITAYNYHDDYYFYDHQTPV
nr:MAG TPA: tail protein [Caudoviricetes sp.]